MPQEPTDLNSDIRELEMWSLIGLVLSFKLIHLECIDPINPYQKPQYYTYKLIETLLPKAMVDLKKSPNIKMIELYNILLI